MSIYDKASLVLIPSGTKTSKVYSQKPTNGDGDFTFSRSTAATRVNASGNIEKETQNLLLQSNTFSNATWLKANVTPTSGQAGYDGTSNAWRLDKAAASGNLQQNISQSGVSTLSVYAKAGTLDWARIRINTTGTTASAYYDLVNGVLGGVSGDITAEIESVASGWYRLSLTINATTAQVRIYPADGDFDLSGTSGSIYIQDSQLEQGMVARDVITTTTTAIYGGITDNVPRLDYTDSSCPSILLEPQRSNLVPFSEHLESSDWAKTRCTIEDNSTTSPEGVINASKMTSTDASESYIQDNLTTTGTKVTWSFFAKKGDLDYAHGLIWDLSANGCRQWFNLSTGAVGGTTTFGSGYSVDSATIEDYGNGWYRCAMVVNSTAGTQGCRVNISSADTTISSAVNSYGYFYGIQLEDASYETSYIPTYGSAVTRNRDDNGLSNVADLIGQTEGTMFFEGSVEHTPQNVSIMNFDRSTQFSVSFFKATNDRINGYVYNGGSAIITLYSAAISGKFKCAIAYKSGDTAFYVNGVQVGVNTTTFTPAAIVDEIYIGSYSTPYFAYDHPVECNQALVFKTRLSNEELAALTTI